MAHTDFVLLPPDEGVAGSRQGAIAMIVRAARLGLYTAAEARLLIDQVRARATTDPRP
jgi:hypothetical protein